jgi:hypothetical protein
MLSWRSEFNVKIENQVLSSRRLEDRVQRQSNPRVKVLMAMDGSQDSDHVDVVLRM